MTVAATNLTSGRDNTDASSYATAAVTPSAATKLVLVAVFNSKGSTADTPTISGGGLAAWVQVATIQSNNGRCTVFRGMGTPGAAAAITIDFAGNTQTVCGWSVNEFDGVDTTGTSGSGAVVQSATNSGNATSGTVTLAAFGSANNATFGAFGHQANEGTTPGTGFTELSDNAGTNPTTAGQTEFRNDNATTVDASWTTAANWRGVAVEIKAAGAAGQTIAPAGLASSAAVGSATVTRGPVTVAPTGLASSAAVGAATVTRVSHIAATHLTAGRDPTDATTYDTAAVAPSAGALILLAVYNTKQVTPNIPAISGGGVTTWVMVDTVLRGSTQRLTIFRGLTMAPGAAAPIHIDFTDQALSGVQTSCAWSVDQFTNVDQTGGNGAGAVVQAVNTNSGSATSTSITLAAFGSADNATYGAIAHQANEGATPGAGFTELADVSGTGPASDLMVEFRSDNDTTVDASWTTSTTSLGIALELKAGVSGAQTISPAGIARTPTFGTATVTAPGAVAAWDSTKFYEPGDVVTFGGKTWVATAPTSAQQPPQGVGDGTVGDRQLLLDDLNRGWAGGLVTGGGTAGTLYVVTNDNASGAGSLRAALEDTNPLWIVFADDFNIRFTSDVNIQPNKTIDGRGHRVTIGGYSIQYIDRLDFDPNLIFAFVGFADIYSSSNQSLAVIIGGSANGADPGARGLADKVYYHHCEFQGIRDAAHSVGYTTTDGTPKRQTAAWNHYGPGPNETLVDISGGIRAVSVDAATDTFTCTAHGFTENQQIELWTRPGFAPPTGLPALGAGQDFFARDVTANTFKVSTTKSGGVANAAVDITGNGNLFATRWDLNAPYLAGKGPATGVNHSHTGDPMTGDAPGNIKATYTLCLFDRQIIRQPKTNAAYLHVFNNVTTKWGKPEGTVAGVGLGVDIDDAGQVLSEYNSYTPYVVGEAHHWGDYVNPPITWPVIQPGLRAILVESQSVGHKVRARNDWLHDGAIYSGFTQTDPDFLVGGNAPYTYTPVTDEATLTKMVTRGAGNVQPWTVQASTAQNITPAGISRTPATGTPTITKGAAPIAPAGVASSAAVGSATVRGANTVVPAGVASSAAVGSATVTGANTVAPAGLASSAAVGSATVARGALTIQPAGVASSVAVGAPVIGRIDYITPAGVASSAAVGSATVTPVAYIQPAGLASTATMGAATLAPRNVAAPAGVASSAAVGTPVVARGPVTIAPAGLASSAATGSAIVAGHNTLEPDGAAPTSATGTPTIYALGRIQPAGIGPYAAVGDVDVLRGANIVTPAGIGPYAAVGAATVTAIARIQPAGLASTFAAGRLIIVTGPDLDLDGPVDAVVRGDNTRREAILTGGYPQ